MKELEERGCRVFSVDCVCCTTSSTTTSTTSTNDTNTTGTTNTTNNDTNTTPYSRSIGSIGTSISHKLHIPSILLKLLQLGYKSVMVEGGTKVLESFLPFYDDCFLTLCTR
jgi:riboflavin biosynthesis pyrimidine reductase